MPLHRLPDRLPTRQVVCAPSSSIFSFICLPCARIDIGRKGKHLTKKKNYPKEPFLGFQQASDLCAEGQPLKVGKSDGKNLRKGVRSAGWKSQIMLLGPEVNFHILLSGALLFGECNYCILISPSCQSQGSVPCSNGAGAAWLDAHANMGAVPCLALCSGACRKTDRIPL